LVVVAAAVLALLRDLTVETQRSMELQLLVEAAAAAKIVEGLMVAAEVVQALTVKEEIQTQSEPQDKETPADVAHLVKMVWAVVVAEPVVVDKQD
jgi:hypothetical protein